MARKLEVSGGKKEIVISLEGVERASFGFDADITASELYEALDFSLNTRYEFAKGGAGDLPADVFNAFCSMVEEIVRGVNGLAEPNGDDGRDCQDNDSEDDEIVEIGDSVGNLREAEE